MRRAILAMLLGVTIVACGGESPSAPPTHNPSGGWTSTNGNSRITMTLNNVNGSVTGNGQFTQGTTSIAL